MENILYTHYFSFHTVPQCSDTSVPILSCFCWWCYNTILHLLQFLCHVEKSDDFKYFLELHDKLPVTLLHFVSEPVLECIDGLPTYLQCKSHRHANKVSSTCPTSPWGKTVHTQSLLDESRDFPLKDQNSQLTCQSGNLEHWQHRSINTFLHKDEPHSNWTPCRIWSHQMPQAQT